MTAPENNSTNSTDNVTNGAATAANNLGEQIQHTANKAADSVQHTVHKVRDTAQQIPQQVQQTIQQVGGSTTQTAAEARQAMRENAYTVKETAADSLLAAAENIRREAVKSGNEEIVRQAQQLSRSMEKAALYLDGHTFEQIGQDATEVVKSNPWQSVGVVFLIGLLLGMLFGSERD